MTSRKSFDSLPLEMQMQLLGFVSPTDQMSFRLVSKSCNEIMKSTNLLSFKSCRLSDSTYQTVIDSTGCFVSEVHVTHLSTRSLGLPARRSSAIQGVSKIIIGSRISARNLSSILFHCTNIHHVHFKDSDAAAVSTFLSHSQLHPRITGLSISFDICSTDDFQPVATLLSRLNLKSLKSFNAVIQPTHHSPDNSYLLGETELQNFHKLYCGIHKVVVNHEQTLSELDWNFSGMIPQHAFVPGTDGLITYKRILRELRKVKRIKKFALKPFHDEGGQYFNLSADLLLSQGQLESLSLTTVPSSHASRIEAILGSSRHSLRELVIDRPQFFLPFLEGLDALKSLRVKCYTFHRFWPDFVMGEVDVAEINNLPLPRGLEELSVEVDCLCCHVESDQLHNFIRTSLLQLRRLELSLKTDSFDEHVFLNETQFEELMSLPLLEKAVISFVASQKDGSDTQLILEKRRILQDLCEGVTGIKTETSDKVIVDDEQNFLYSRVFQLVVLIDRKVFVGLRI